MSITYNRVLFVVFSLWFVVYGLWFVVYGLWFIVYGLWFMVYGLLYLQPNTKTQITKAGYYCRYLFL